MKAHRHASTREIMKIADLLKAAYDEDQSLYKDGWSDERISGVINDGMDSIEMNSRGPLSKSSVARIRLELYGPFRRVTKMDRRADSRLDSLSSRLDELATEVDMLKQRLAAIERITPGASITSMTTRLPTQAPEIFP